MGGDKMIFYVNDCFDKECLKDNIDTFEQIYNQKFSQNRHINLEK